MECYNLCIVIIVAKDIAIIASIALEYFTVVNKAEYHSTGIQ